jgi:hypothetical protein
MSINLMLMVGFLINRYNVTGATADVLRYSISLDKIEKVSSLSAAYYGGLALLAHDRKSIYYFSGTVVHKFYIVTNITVRLPTALPSQVMRAGGFTTARETFFIFNGQETNIMEFSEESESARIIGELSF